MKERNISFLFSILIFNLFFIFSKQEIVIDGNFTDWPGNPSCALGSSGCSEIWSNNQTSGNAFEISNVWTNFPNFTTDSVAAIRLDASSVFFSSSPDWCGEIRLCFRNFNGSMGTEDAACRMSINRLIVINFDLSSNDFVASLHNCDSGECGLPLNNNNLADIAVTDSNIEFSFNLTDLGMALDEIWQLRVYSSPNNFFSPLGPSYLTPPESYGFLIFTTENGTSDIITTTGCNPDSCNVCGGDGSTCGCTSCALGSDTTDLDYDLWVWSQQSSLNALNQTLSLLLQLQQNLNNIDYNGNQEANVPLGEYIDVLNSFCSDCLEQFDFAQIWLAEQLGNFDFQQ